jgi:hypothetical protein
VTPLTFEVPLVLRAVLPEEKAYPAAFCENFKEKRETEEILLENGL